MRNLQTVLNAYIEAALWSSSSEGYPLDDTYTSDDLAPTTLTKFRLGIEAFLSLMPENNLSDEQIGHDFWLTRNRHGSGFWDRGLGDLGLKLTELAHEFKETNLYVGDDQKIYF